MFFVTKEIIYDIKYDAVVQYDAVLQVCCQEPSMFSNSNFLAQIVGKLQIKILAQCFHNIPLRVRQDYFYIKEDPVLH